MAALSIALWLAMAGYGYAGDEEPATQRIGPCWIGAGIDRLSCVSLRISAAPGAGAGHTVLRARRRRSQRQARVAYSTNSRKVSSEKPRNSPALPPMLERSSAAVTAGCRG